MSPDAATLGLELYSVAPVTRGCGRLLGEALLRHPRFVPSRIGSGDPARTRVTDLPVQLEELVDRQLAGGDIRMLLASPEREEYLWVGLRTDPLAGHPPRQGRPSHLELGTRATPEQTAALFADLADLVDPYLGWVTTRAAQLQRLRFEASRRLSDPSPPTRAMGRDPHVYHEVCVEDVFWVQAYGPAFLHRWGGPDVLDGLGVEQRRLRNGGVVVRLTETPRFDRDATAPEDASWKEPLYHRVGPQVFARDDQPWGRYGERVPLFVEHARHALGWDGP